MTDVLSLPGTAIARLIRDRQISVVEVMEKTRERAAQVQQICNPFVTLGWSEAFVEAQRCDRHLQQSSVDPLPPLYGIPFTVKDLLSTQGMRTTYGSRSFGTHVPDEDVVAVARLRAAGAILIGKTTTPEFAAQVLTDSVLSGITRNPWDTTLTPGGSSGGAGVAAATGVGPFAISTDGGGSSRIPAAACGVLGLKVTMGAIPHESWPFHFGNNSSISINCRYPEDLVAMFNVMAGSHHLDPWSRRAIKPVAVRSEKEDTLKGKKALFIAELAGLQCDASLLRVNERALDKLRSRGLEVTQITSDPLDFAPGIATQMMAANLAARVRAMRPEQQTLLGPVLRSLLVEKGFHSDGVQMQAEAIGRSRLYDRLEGQFRHYDLILTPTLNARPPPADPEEDQRVKINGEPASLERWWSHLSIANLTGHPAISIPCGTDEQGLPVGLHAIADWDCEQQLVDLALVMASVWDWTQNFPSLDND